MAVERLLPHLRQFVRVRQALVGAPAPGRSVLDLLDSVRVSVIRLDRRARVAAANDRARALLRAGDGLSDGDGGLRAALPREDSALQRLFARALPFLGGPGAGGSMLLSRPESPSRLVLHVSPVHDAGSKPGRNHAGALVRAVDPAEGAKIEPELVEEALGPTRAESRIAVLIAQGKSIDAVAGEEGDLAGRNDAAAAGTCRRGIAAAPGRGAARGSGRGPGNSPLTRPTPSSGSRMIVAGAATLLACLALVYAAAPAGAQTDSKPGTTTVPRAEGVCDRTTQVRDGLVAAANVNHCSLVTDAKLGGITYLNLNGTGITSLKAGDFAGLSALRWLYLEDNELTLDTVPAGVFDSLLVGRSPDAIGVQGNPGCPSHGDRCFAPSPTLTVGSGETERTTYRTGEVVALSVSKGDYKDLLSRSTKYAWKQNSGPSVALAGRKKIPPFAFGGSEYAPPSGKATWFEVLYVSEETTATFAVELTPNSGRWSRTTLTNFWSKVVTEVELTFAPPLPSPDTSLSTLTVDGVDASLDSTGNYATTVVNSVDSVTVTAVASARGASIVIDPADADAAEGGHQINLSTGGNSIKITVTASDQTTRKDHTLTVTRETEAGVCGRTEQVRNKLVELTDAADCMSVTAAQLSEITNLDLDNQSIASLQAHDFAGLTGLQYLNLRNNLLSLDSFPGGIFGTIQRNVAQVLRYIDVRDNPGCPSHGNRCFAPSPNVTVGDGAPEDLTVFPNSAMKISVGMSGYRDPLGRSLEYAWEQRSGASAEPNPSFGGQAATTLFPRTSVGENVRYAVTVTPVSGRWRRTVENAFWSEAVRETPEIRIRELGLSRKLTAKPGNGEVSLTWEPPSVAAGLRVAKYQVRTTRGSNSWSHWSDVIPVGGPNSLQRRTVYGLTNGTNYRFEVRAAIHDRANRRFRFGDAAALEAMPDGTGALATYTVGGQGTVACDRPRAMSLRIAAPPQPRLLRQSCELANTALTYVKGRGMTPESAAAVMPLIRELKQIEDDIPCGTGPYWYYRRTGLEWFSKGPAPECAVRTTRSGGKLPWRNLLPEEVHSGEDEGWTENLAPGRRPRNLAVEATTAGNVLRWQAPRLAADEVTGYRVLRRAPKKGEGSLEPVAEDTGSADTSWMDVDVEEGVTYVYRVKAIRARELSGLSNSRRVTATGTPAPEFTARFEGLPAHHDGRTAFTFELHFSETPARTSYRTVQGDLLEVTGANVTHARRLVQGSDQGWEVTVAPSGGDDIAVALPVRACGAANAVCANGQPLARAASAMVPRAPFTASFSQVPAGHDGTNAFELRFELSEEPADVSYRTVRDSLFAVTGGRIENASRLVRGKDKDWTLKVAPSGNGDVTLTVKATTACNTEPGICTEDGKRMLDGGLSVTVQGPVALSVADAEVDEAEGATLDFAVTLSRRSDATATVDYATSDGTATAGSDYTETSGRVTFMAGETSKTVSVPVLDDAHDEGSETMTLTLSNPSGAAIEDGEATGTINNTDAMPKVWIARFGRTVAEQVLHAVEGRLEAPRSAGVEASLAGQRLGGAAPVDEAAERREAEAGMTALTEWLRGKAGEEDVARGFETRAVSERELLLGSSFALTGGSAETGFGALWGRASVSGFDGRDGDLTVDGEVTSAMLGAGWSRGRATAGLAVAHSRGEGSYRSPGGDGAAESALTGVYPYGRYALSERLSVWGVAGLGRGSLTLKPATGTRIETDMALAMGALGLRGVLVEAPAEGGIELSVKTDAMAVRTTSDAASGEDGGNMAAAEADVTRLRLGLQATLYGMNTGGDGILTPSLEIGVRHDGGDAETGFGADIGAGLTWADPGSGLTADIRARGLLAHEADGFSERGFSGTLSWDPEPSTVLGPSLTLTQTVGAASSGGAEALLGRGTMEGLAPDDGGDELERRTLEARLGYGFALFGGGYTGTPEVGLGLTGAYREMSLGWRLAGARRAGLAFGLDVEGARRESETGDGKAEHRLGLGLGWRLEGMGAQGFELRFEGTRLDAANDDSEHRVGVRMSARW